MRNGKKAVAREKTMSREQSAHSRPEPTWTVAQLRRHFGMIPAERFLLHPRPGMATEEDLIHVNEHGDRLCELVDGVLVEKTMGWKESFLALALSHFLQNFLDQHNLGIVLGADAAMKLVPGLIRAPDVSFISWERFPGGRFPDEPVPHLTPDLAIEVISKSNTKKEMERKLQEYFEHGVVLVWYIYPKKETVEVFTSPVDKRTLSRDDVLDGGQVLPGFALPLSQLFAPRRRPTR
jgi:Uma2 family endonuclease